MIAKKTSAFVSLAVASMVALSACGSGNSNGSPPNPSPRSGAAPPRASRGPRKS